MVAVYIASYFLYAILFHINLRLNTNSSVTPSKQKCIFYTKRMFAIWRYTKFRVSPRTQPFLGIWWLFGGNALICIVLDIREKINVARF